MQSYDLPSGLSIAGAWTKAGCASCVQVKGPGKLDLLFDCGIAETQTLTAKHVFITHGHVDHIGSAIIHARSRSLSHSSAKYFVPKECEQPLQQALAAFEQLDGKPIPMDIIPVSVGNVLEVCPGYCVRVMQTIHRVPSVGYALCKIKQGAVLPEYQALPQKDLYLLKKAGTNILQPSEQIVEIVYTGDTVMEAFLLPENQYILQTKVLITELTYLDGDYEKAKLYSHMHMQDIVTHEKLFETVEKVIFVHLSSKYAPHSRAVSILRSSLPPLLQAKTLVSLHSFGSEEVLTSLAEVCLEDCRRIVGWGWSHGRLTHRNNHNNNNNNNSSNNSSNRHGRGRNNSNRNSNDSAFVQRRSFSAGKERRWSTMNTLLLDNNHDEKSSSNSNNNSHTNSSSSNSNSSNTNNRNRRPNNNASELTSGKKLKGI